MSIPKEGVVPFVRVIIDITWIPPWERRNGGTPVGYLERAILRREQCDMKPENES
jgi:hypothetical protein